jgi:cytochrome P450
VTPGPRGLAALPRALAMRRDPLGFVLSAMRTYGDVVRMPVPGRTIFLLASPEAARHVLCERHANFTKGIGLDDARGLLGDGLLTGDGQAWTQSRKRVHGLFDRERQPAFEDAVLAAARGTAQRWSAADRGADIDVGDEMDRLALTVAGRVFLDADLDAVAGAVSRHFSTLSWYAMRRATALFPGTRYVPTTGSLRAAYARRSLTAILHRIRSGPGAASREELATLLMAGYDTSAATLSWSWHLLARHPAVRETVERELDALPECSGVQALESLPYLRQVIAEAMRLYPAVWILPRRSIARDCIAGHDVPAGADVLVCVAALHRNPAHWTEPERFDPSRFDPVRTTSRDPFAYLPFGGGPRACIGSRYGTTEVLLALSVLARTFRLDASGAPMPRPSAGLTLRPGGHGRLRLWDRSAAAFTARRFAYGARARI